MIIPTKFKLSRKRWAVAKYPTHATEAGRCFADARVIHINMSVRGRKRTPQQVADTFWHELTHGILFDMQHPKAYDEKFVQEFSKRLSEAVRTAVVP